MAQELGYLLYIKHQADFPHTKGERLIGVYMSKNTAYSRIRKEENNPFYDGYRLIEVTIFGVPQVEVCEHLSTFERVGPKCDYLVCDDCGETIREIWD